MPNIFKTYDLQAFKIKREKKHNILAKASFSQIYFTALRPICTTDAT